MKKFLKGVFKLIVGLFFIVLFLILLLLFWPDNSEVKGGRVFYDDFSDNSQAWSTNALRTIQDGKFVLRTASRYIQTPDVKLRDGEVRLKMKFPQKGFAGIVFRKEDAERYDVVFVNAKGSVVLAHRVAGSYRNIIRDSINLQNPQDFHELGVRFEGDKVTVGVDSREKSIFTYPGHYSYGSVGLAVEKATFVEFDSLEILDWEKMVPSVSGTVKLGDRVMTNVEVRAYQVLNVSILSGVFVGSVRTDSFGKYHMALPATNAYFINARVKGASGGRYIDFDFEQAPFTLDVHLQARGEEGTK